MVSHTSSNMPLNSLPPSDLMRSGWPCTQITFVYNHLARVSDDLLGKAPKSTYLEKLSTITTIWVAPSNDGGLMSGIKSIEYIYLGLDPM